MKNTKNIEILKKYFSFLISSYNFKLKEIESLDYALYAKFLSDKIGIYLIYEFRDFIPQLQLTKLESKELNARPGFYTIRELYKNESFKLLSFYLDEILLYKEEQEYRNYFKDVTTIDDSIKITTELLEKYAMDFVKGNEESYIEMDKWYRTHVIKK